MSKAVHLSGVLCDALLAGTMAFASDAQAGSGSATWEGPNGGTVHWQGYGQPGFYRRAVTVTTPDGRIYRRVTKAGRGPNGGAYYSRRRVGPNGGAVYRRWGY